MFARQNMFALASLAIVSGSVALPATVGFAEPSAPLEAPAPATPAYFLDLDVSRLDDDAVTAPAPVQREAADDAALSSELECMAKVVHHEAGNQSRQGQLAVAQIMINRARSGRFPATICGVANQPGQFFNVNAYNPNRASPRWQAAVNVSREALAGAPDVTKGAYFYHAAYAGPNQWFRTRERVMTLGDHIFYR
jgi:N-acetylmuramoyl-L-alanine amidase